MTKSAIANGADGGGQIAKTGQTAEQTLASLNRDTASANQAIGKILDVQKLKDEQGAEVMGSEDTAQGRELLDFIEKMDQLAWKKFESRYPEIQFRGQQPKMEDRSAMPPYTSFRFENEDPEVIHKLRFAVETYSGEIEWVMEGHPRDMFPGTTNWVIYPKRTAESRKIALDADMVVGQYMALNYPEFGPVAYSDLLGLVSHIRSVFSGE